MKKHQSGFTLAEMTVVIVVLGILSAFFIPKFEKLIVDARIAKVERLAGTLQEAAAITHATQIAEQLGEAISVDMNGTAAGGTVTMDNRYPTANTTGITAAIDSYIAGSVFGADKGQFTDNGAGEYVLNGATADCKVTYVGPAAVGELPTVTVSTTGCE
ncbi:pilin [Sinimarinibacterium flocculans]|uniref:pilin n=1 Tax=Sinimarinibacterium flocculans TaxID=985250 RepID=UPI0035147BCC